MINSNPIYFPKTLRIRNEIIDLGSQDVKELYNSKNLKVLINETFSEEYSQYLKGEQYFPGCPFKIYQKNYQLRLKTYLSIRPDADEFDFLTDEDALISRILDMSDQVKGHYYSFYSGLNPEPHKANLKRSAEKTRCFIDSRIEELGHYFYAPGFDDPFDVPDSLPRHYFEPARNPEAEDQRSISLSEIQVAKQEITIPRDAKVFNTVWEAVLYHSVLVRINGEKYYCSKKDIPELTSSMYLPEGKSISPNSFYNKLRAVEKAAKGIITREGRYTWNDYEAVKNRFREEYPEAVFTLSKEYFYNELC